MDSAIQWINHYPLDNAINFDSTYPLDNDLSSGQRYPPFEQLGPDSDLSLKTQAPAKLIDSGKRRFHSTLPPDVSFQCIMS